MSVPALAVAQPQRPEQTPTRHLEIAPTHAQRRARPKLVYAVIVVGGIGTILLAQLLLSIATAGGAYRISALQVQQRDLSRQQSAAQERLNVLRSTQNLTRDAEALGMISSGNPMFLNATTGQVTGAASAAGGSLTGGSNLIPNALLSGAAIDAAAVAAQNQAADQAAQNATAQNQTAQGGGQPTAEEGGGISTPDAPATPGTAAASGTAASGTAAPGTAGTPAGGTPAPAASAPSAPPAPGVLPSPTTH